MMSCNHSTEQTLYQLQAVVNALKYDLMNEFFKVSVDLHATIVPIL